MNVYVIFMTKKKSTYRYNSIKSVLRISLSNVYVLRKSHLFYISIHTLISWLDLVFVSTIIITLIGVRGIVCISKIQLVVTMKDL